MSEMTRENARKIDFYGHTLEECVNWLLKFQEKGESVFVDFNGHNLYSCDVTMDGAYQEVLDMTKAEYDRKKEEWRKENQEREAIEEAEAKAKIPAWIEKGEAFIYPERMKKWKECVEVRASDIYHGTDLDAALILMEKLESGASIEEVKEMFDKQDHSGVSAGIIKSIIFHFSKRGPEFYEGTAWRELSEKEKKIIEDKKRENEEIENGTFKVVEPKVSQGTYTSTDIKDDLLRAMSKTQSWLTLEDVKTILPQEQYQELVTALKSDLEQYYAKMNLTDVSQDEIEQEIEKKIEDEVFRIGVNENGGFIIEQFILSLDKLTTTIDQSQLDATKLASVVEKAMQKHLDYGVFHANRYLTADQIPQTLEQYIDLAKEYQSRNVGKSSEVEEVEPEQGVDELSGRQAEEKEIKDLASEKEELTSEIDEVEKELEELRAQEEELKKESKSNEIEEK